MLRFEETIASDVFDDFAQQHELASINQSAKWADIKYNWIPYHTGLYDNDKLVGVALLLIRPLPLGFKFAYVPRGPLIDFSNLSYLQAMLAGLKGIAKKEKCLFVKMDPNISYRIFRPEERESAKPIKSGELAIKYFEESGAKHLGFTLMMHESFQPRFVAITNYTDTFEQDLPRRTKRFVKDADKKNVVIRRGDLEDLDKFIEVLSSTENRKDITLRDKEYHRLLLTTYGEDAYLSFAEVDLNRNYQQYKTDLENVKEELAKLGENAPKKKFRLEEREASLVNLIEEVAPYLSEFPTTKILSGMLSIRFGNTLEHLYAGFDIQFKKYMPQYKLYVEMIKLGFADGALYNNMGGIEGTLDDGLTEFKSNFNPYIHEYIGEFDIPVSPLYPLFRLAWKIREKRRQ